jgi:selenide,water dikinase
MRMLNATASRAALAAGARCATDVTGFGLLGHASHIARASHVTLHIDARAVPLLAGVRNAWAEGSQTGGGDRNAAYLASRVEWGTADAFTRSVLVDPQTSGGLLVALPRAGAKELQARVADAVEIGYVASRGEVDIVVR